MDAEPEAPPRKLRIAVLGDFDGVHTRSWVRWFIERGHEIHAVSYYPPRDRVEGATEHALRPAPRGATTGGRGAARSVVARLPRGLLRLAHALRYRRAGLAGTVRRIRPDIFHAHYLVEHGFYGATTGIHPYVVTAWGSDVLVEPQRDPVSRLIAKWTIGRADLLTSNNGYMADRIVRLGAPRAKVQVVTLGADRFFLERWAESVNVRGAEGPRAILSTRAHEPLYNIDEILDAYGQAARELSGARLVIAHGGSETAALKRRAAEVGGGVDFAGFLDRDAFRDALTQSQVFVSVPSSDGTSVALLQAMAAGCFPIVSDLPTQRELIDDGVNGFRVPLHRPEALADAIRRALADPELRRAAAEVNRRIVEQRGLNETQMLRMEELYLGMLEAGGWAASNPATLS